MFPLFVYSSIIYGQKYIKSNEQHELYESIEQDGIENFSFEIIEKCSPQLLHERKTYYINKYKSNQSEFGYNIFHTYPRDNKCPNLDYIIQLLSNSGLFMTEIATICSVCNSTVKKINDGKSYQRNIDYPIRSLENKKMLERMRYKECRPSVEFRMNHSASDSYEEYKRICRQKNAAGEKIPIVFDEDIDINFIDEILSTSYNEVIEKYGYKGVTQLQNHLRKVGLPHKLPELKIYYEQQTGHPHFSSYSENKKTSNKRPRISRPVAQYDGMTRKLIDVFLTIADAARATNIKQPSRIIAASQSNIYAKAGGYFWRMINIDGNLIKPTDYAEYYETHQNVCVACGTELSLNAEQSYCLSCQNIKDKATTPDQLSEPTWALYCLAHGTYNSLGVIYNLSGGAIRGRYKLINLTADEISAARETVKQEKLIALREYIPQYLPEEM